MNRREFVMSAASLGLMGTNLLSRKAFAAEGGTIETISDGFLELPTNFLLPNGLPENIPGMSLQEVAAEGTFKVSCNVTAFRGPQGLIVFDCGSGPNFMASAGNLSQNMAAAGIDPALVKDVIFTHAHPDHLWGVVDEFDELLFPEANYHMSQEEFDFWNSEDALSHVGEERQTFVVGARNRFDAMEDRLSFFKPGEEVLPGVEAVAAEGHTPGHTAFVVHGDEPTMVVGDAISNDPISFLRPDLAWGADMDSEAGATTRKRLLDRLANDRMRFVGFHLPDGGMGRVETSGAAYKFVPSSA
ncbi:MBL fold metallo-hydrolase [Fulvimarina sp. MAC3]|uniref:MBL fold metallo-hydrolase n=1 Tax=Fulvimarina sp. MAC3 TaxID=3148887 RepID=UPI0031FC6CE9